MRPQEIQLLPSFRLRDTEVEIPGTGLDIYEHGTGA
jgi:hypothetical protein